MTIPHQLLLAALVAGAFAIALPTARAGSSASSAASDSLSVSVGSLSGSVQQSSESSTSERKVADGDYRIIGVAALTGEPARVRLQLQPAGADPAPAGLALTLPLELLQRHPALQQGATIGARNRPYGLEFSAGAPRQAFFLALNDDWLGELHNVPVRF